MCRFNISSQFNRIINSDILAPLHQKCPHQLVFDKFKLSKIIYAPPYARNIWDYNKSNCDWSNAFADFNVHSKLQVF